MVLLEKIPITNSVKQKAMSILQEHFAIKGVFRACYSSSSLTGSEIMEEEHNKIIDAFKKSKDFTELKKKFPAMTID